MNVSLVRSIALTLCGAASLALAEAPADLKWHWQVTPQSAKAGDEVELRFIADIPEGWILYSTDFKSELGPLPARFTFENNDSVALIGPVQAVNSSRRIDRNFGTEYAYFARQGEFRQKARLLKDADSINGQVKGQTCQEKDGLCALFTESFKVPLLTR